MKEVTMTSPATLLAKGRRKLSASLPLAQAADAHRLLESGEVFGKVVLRP